MSNRKCRRKQLKMDEIPIHLEEKIDRKASYFSLKSIQMSKINREMTWKVTIQRIIDESSLNWIEFQRFPKMCCYNPKNSTNCHLKSVRIWRKVDVVTKIHENLKISTKTSSNIRENSIDFSNETPKIWKIKWIRWEKWQKPLKIWKTRNFHK